MLSLVLVIRSRVALAPFEMTRTSPVTVVPDLVTFSTVMRTVPGLEPGCNLVQVAEPVPEMTPVSPRACTSNVTWLTSPGTVYVLVDTVAEYADQAVVARTFLSVTVIRRHRVPAALTVVQDPTRLEPDIGANVTVGAGGGRTVEVVKDWVSDPVAET